MTSFPYNEPFLFISEIFLIIIEKSWVNVVYRVLAMLKEDFISSNKGNIFQKLKFISLSHPKILKIFKTEG